MDSKIKHLEMIQGIVARLAGNSSSTKSWSIVLMSGLFALAAKDANARYVVAAFFPIGAFWILPRDNRRSWTGAAFSLTQLAFYAPLLAVNLAVLLVATRLFA